MRYLLSIITLSLSMLVASAQSPQVTWQTLGNIPTADGHDYHIQRFTVKNGKNLARIAFNRFASKMKAVNPSDTVVEIIPGYYYVATPRLADNDVVTIDLITPGILLKNMSTPDGVHGVTPDGKVVNVEYSRLPLTDDRNQWSVPSYDLMPYGDSIYRFNQKIIDMATKPSAFDIIPSLKSVEVKSRRAYKITEIVFPEFKRPERRRGMHLAAEHDESYDIIIRQGVATIEAASPRGAMLARTSLNRLIERNDSMLPDAVIHDAPDFPYRGLLIDAARNFLPYEDLKWMAELMSRYKFNKLHFHLVDDEGWRLEIPGLPELTEVGARRGYTLDEHDHLASVYWSNGDPNSTEGSANGYYSREQFIEILKMFHAKGIDVIPEIESPGHARAAIRAMEARYRHSGDDTYRLIEDNDTSRYTSAQDYHDCVMNPALPGPYFFMDKVITEIRSMYREARVPLTSIHIGGDEVPRGAWSGSPSAQALIKAKGMRPGEYDLHAYFVERIARILYGKNIKMSGWQEVAIGHSDSYNARTAPNTYSVNCWTFHTPGDTSTVSDQAVANGFPIILSSVNHFYLDLAYNYHPEERGMTWGGVVDEIATLTGYPHELCHTSGPGKVIGLQGQLFAETIRSGKQRQYYLLPKMLGLAERAWNAKATYSPEQFVAFIGTTELPALASDGFDFRLRQPGLIIKEGRLYANSPYPEAEIRYTLDGCEPTLQSPIYRKPVKTNASEIRAKLFYLGRQSVTTILYNK